MARDSGSGEGASIAKALSRATSLTGARVHFEEEVPFGPTLLVRRWVLGNGLTVFTCPDPVAPVVSFMSWYDVGSRHEVPGKTGLAHLFEHLMFSGTKHHPAGEFDRRMEEAGAETNAATWVDWTYYYDNVPKAALPLALALESDRMQHLSLDPRTVANEKDVVANEREFRVDDDVEGSTNEKLYGTAFATHPYRFPTIGTMEDIRGLTLEDCVAFYRQHYAPNKATLVFVGDFDEKDLLSAVQASYGTMKPSRAKALPLAPEPPQKRERRLRFPQPTATDKLAIGYRAPALAEPDHAVLTVANEILFGGRSSRIHQLLVHDLELCSETQGSIAPFHDPGLHEVWLSMRAGKKAADALARFDAELERLGREGTSEAELEKAKNRLELGFLQGMETAQGKAEPIGFHHLVTGDVRTVFGQLDAYRSVRSEDVKRVVRAILRPSHRTVVHVVPDGSVS